MIIKLDRIGGVMVSMLTSSVVDRGFEPHSVKPKTLRRKSKDRLAWNQYNVSKWGDMSIPQTFVSVS